MFTLVPTSPFNNACSMLGCKASRARGGYCEAHASKARPRPMDPVRSESNARYSRSDWQRMRLAQLSVSPICQCCYLKGRIVQAEAVDHVYPWRVLGGDCFTRSPLQSLCASCHRLKTWLERRGIFRHYTQAGIVDLRPADYFNLVT